MQYKVGDEVVLPLKIEKICNEELVGAKSEADVTYLFKIEEANRVLKPRESKTYSEGLADAWELASKIVCHESAGGMSDKVFCDVFGAYGGFESVFADLTYEEALAKIEAYEKAEIKEGDVVKVDGLPCVVTAVYKDSADVLFKDGSCENSDKTHIEKTGKHIDIESLLRQIGE